MLTINDDNLTILLQDSIRIEQMKREVDRMKAKCQANRRKIKETRRKHGQ